jgi:FKBP-type peptidyl-prolyl cis-trans isomerases 1
MSGQGLTPKASDKVQVHYVGALLDGTEFDNSFKRGEPLEFPVSAVIEGWQDLLMVMHEGMKVKAWIPSALAYGEEGVPPSIPANSLPRVRSTTFEGLC